MEGWLKLAHGIDKLNEQFGKIAVWGAFIACMVSAGNATIRYLLHMSSNGWLEVQWYLFSVNVLLGAAFVLKVNEHVRVDVLYTRYSSRTKAWVDLMGMIVFLMPGSLLLVWMSWPWFWDSFVTHEMSNNAGGLIRWPVKLLIPLGFAILSLQGLAEIIKRIAYLRGLYAMDTHYERPLQ